MFRNKLLRWEYIPATVALVAAGVLLMAPYAKADPAILKGANGVACQIPLNAFNPLVGQYGFTPADENDVKIATLSTPSGIRAFGTCNNVDLKVDKKFVATIAPSLPFEVKINSDKLSYRKIFCRMEDSDNIVYYSKDWKSLIRIELVGTGQVKVTKKLRCLNGRSK